MLENPSYFSVSPASAPFSFTSGVNAVGKSFCVSPVGSHPDLECVLVPLQQAIPGMDCLYRIVYRNNGNVTQSGNVTFAFTDALMDFVSSVPVHTEQIVPIITNTASTTIQQLSAAEQQTASALILYPNPTRETVRLQTTMTDVHEVQFYDQAGRWVLFLLRPDLEQIAVSQLAVGSYFVKVIGNGSSQVVRMVKE